VQLDRFWHRVTEGLELSQLWKQFSADARASYRLYHRDFQARAPQEIGKPGFWHTAQEYAWAILEKLTPARRVLLLLGILLLVFPAGGFSYHGKSGEIEVVVGRGESRNQVACARPPSQNPPSRFPATGSPGCSR